MRPFDFYSSNLEKIMLAWYCHINYGLGHKPGQKESSVDTWWRKSRGSIQAVSFETWKKVMEIIHRNLLNHAIDPRRSPKNTSRAGEDTDYDEGNLSCCQDRNSDELLKKLQGLRNVPSYLYPKKVWAMSPETALHSGILAKVHSPIIYNYILCSSRYAAVLPPGSALGSM